MTEVKQYKDMKEYKVRWHYFIEGEDIIEAGNEIGALDYARSKIKLDVNQVKIFAKLIEL